MKNLKAIILLFIANSISGFAQGISMIAIPWYFADIIQKPSLFGLAYAAITVVSLFWGLYVGTLVDKYNRKHLFLVETGVGCLLLLSIAGIGYSLGHVPVYLVIMVFAITFFAYNLHYPSLYAFAQEITAPEDYEKITSYLEIQGQATYITAGGIGALLLSGVEGGVVNVGPFDISILFSIAPWGLQDVFLLDGCTYFLSFIIISFITYESVAERKIDSGDIVSRFKHGINYLRENRLIFIFGNAAYFLFVTTLVTGLLLQPNFVKQVLNAGGNVYGLSEMFFAGGAILSGFAIQGIFSRKSPVLACIAMSSLGAITLLIFAYTRDVRIFLFACLLQGLANSGSRIMRVTYIFRHIPNSFIGRSQGVFQVINVFFRICFILLFSLPFFVNHIPYCYLVFSFFTFVSIGILVYYYEELKAL